MQLETGAKVWLWIIFVLNIISCVMAGIGALGVLTLLGVVPFILTICSIAVCVLLIIGIAMLLFSGKKAGFYIMCACAVLGAVLNLLLGTGIIRAAVNAVFVPLVTYVLLQKQWDELA